jgi:hypothetical protein
MLKFNPWFSGYFSTHQIESRVISKVGGFPCEVTIQPQECFSEFLNVKIDGSFIFVSFNTANYNIGFSIEGLLPYCVYDSHFKPFQKTIKIQRGVYQIKWHNEYSYVNSKVLKYKVRVL